MEKAHGKFSNCSEIERVIVKPVLQTIQPINKDTFACNRELDAPCLKQAFFLLVNYLYN